MTTNPLTGNPFSSRYWTIQETLRHRPILTYKEAFLKVLDENQILLVTGDIDKSTQVPQWCVEYVQERETTGRKTLIGCTQPKRARAVSLAQQVADQFDSPIGDHIGYSIRFEDRTSPKTFLKYCTDGLLLREMIHFHLLENYQIIVVDEAQERTIGTDILLPLLRGITKQRKDFKLVVMASSDDAGTLTIQQLQQYLQQQHLDGCPVIEMGENRTGIVEESPEIDRVDSEISRADPEIVQIHPEDRRIDPKIVPIDPEIHRVDTEIVLSNPKISRIKPEISRIDLINVVLLLKKLGMNDLADFDFITSPPPEALTKAIDFLTHFGALDKDGKMTEMGSKMAEFPLEPRLSRVLLASADLGCIDEILSIVAMLSVPHHFIGSSKGPSKSSIKNPFTHPFGDHLKLLQIFHAYKANNDDPQWCQENDINYDAIKRVDRIRSQLATIQKAQSQEELNLTQINLNNDPTNIQKALLIGHFMQVAYLGSDANYRTLQDDKIVHLDSSTSIKGHPKWVIYNELTAENSIRLITEVKREWIIEMVPDLLIDRPFVSATNDD